MRKAPGTPGAALVALLLLAGAARGAPTTSGDGSGGPAGAVTARLVADVTEVAPGEPFQLGLDIRMAEGWHTYWENGGDAGLPTSVEWELPEGFRTSPIRWPVPHRYEDEGDVVTFGYTDRVLLLVDVTPPGRLGDEPIRIAGAVDWLQCKDICIPGHADVDLVLRPAGAPVPAPEPVLERFREARAQLPVSAASREELGVQAFQSLDAIPPGTEAEVAVVFRGLGDADPASCGFFPRPSDDLWMRDGTFRSDGRNLALVIPVEVDGAVAPGAVVTLPGVVRIPRPDGGDPRLLSFAIPVSVAEEGATPRRTDAPVFAEDGGPFLTAAASGPAAGPAAPLGAGRLLRFLVLAFLGGIILNVMPCVLPVVSLKVLGFVSKAEEHPGRVARLGWTFAAGVVSSFLVLAVLVIALKSAGEHIGWGFQFQNPVFVAALAVVVFVFSLSLLGVFEVGATTAMLGLGLAAKERKDYADAFFHGILTTILATPCTAPMLGAAVAFAFSQPAPVILAVFLTVSAGLAFPYVLLSMHPGWLRYVPKPGPWMDRFKQAMGFLLLATLVWLLFVFGAQMGTDALAWLLAFLLVVAFFAWMHGTFLDLSSSGRRTLLVWGLTVLGVGAGYRSFLHDRLFGETPAAASAEAPGLRSDVEVTEGGVRWEPFSVDYLEASVRSGRTVFLDLTADWCWTCKVNERTVLSDEDIERLFHEYRVLTLKGDWTRRDPEITRMLQRHDRAGVPFYAVYPAGRPEDVIVLPEIINKRLVMESLRKAGPSRRADGA
jgi:thiol:disulfide interchange protein DsbD